MTNFTPIELKALKAFYAGTRARQIRKDLDVDPWPLVARHRAMPQEEHEKVQRRIRGPRNPLGEQTWIKEALPDNPIFKRGFVIAGQKRPYDADK